MIDLTLEKCLEGLRTYNSGTYRGRPNVDIDREGYALFQGGLPADIDALTRMVLFTGDDYGGTQARFLPDGFGAESARIARAIQRTGHYSRVVQAQLPLSTRVPPREDLRTLLEPFRATKYWLVWGSKFLHFLAPISFPIMDSRAEGYLHFRRTDPPDRTYHDYCTVIQAVLVRNMPVLTKAATHDPTGAPILKLLDKVLFEEGKPKARSRVRRGSTPAQPQSVGSCPASVVEGFFLPAWVTNIASHADRARGVDRYELCLAKEHAGLFPGHRGWVELVVASEPWRAQVGIREGVRHIYFWAGCTGAAGEQMTMTALLRSVGIKPGDSVQLVLAGQHRFELRGLAG